jgi:hypothetical protein
VLFDGDCVRREAAVLKGSNLLFNLYNR